MMKYRSSSKRPLFRLAAIALFAGVAGATALATDAAENAGRATPAASACLSELLAPALGSTAIAWLAAAAALMLTLQTRPFLCLRTLDGFVLAAACLLFPLRAETGVAGWDRTGLSVQTWATLLLTLAAVYWLGRGVHLVVSANAPRRDANLSTGALLVVVLAGLAVSVNTIATAPLSDASQDGLVGGEFTHSTGKLPYGDTLGHDNRSPLLYLLHAGAIRVTPGTVEWTDTSASPTREDELPARLVNGLLFLMTLGAVLVLGSRLHSPAMGMTLAALLGLFPGTLECLPQPNVMLAAALVAWTLAFATLPGVGGLLSAAALLLAGLAWPWAWLAAPGLLAFFLRRGWHAFGATIGLAGALAAVVVALPRMVEPALPRSDGALAAAGMPPQYRGFLAGDGAVEIQAMRPDPVTSSAISAWFWKLLVEMEDTRISQGELFIGIPSGLDAGSVRYRDIKFDPRTGPALQDGYRRALREAPVTTRAWVALRSVLESTWKPSGSATVAQPAGSWAHWAAASTLSAETWTMIRRAAKLALGVAALFFAFVLFGGTRAGMHQLVGAFTALAAGALLASEPGAVTNWAWMLPAALAAVAVYVPAAPTPSAPPAVSPAALEPAPRITIEQ